MSYLPRILFFVWLAVFGSVVYLYFQKDLPIKEYPILFTHFFDSLGFWGPLLYFYFYLVRPLIFFPAWLMAVISGALFGPVYGLIVTLIGENISANVAYWFGRYFGNDFIVKLTKKNKFAAFGQKQFQEKGFLTVLILRLLYFPTDITSYLSGAYKTREKHFIVATFLGLMPDMFILTFIGGSFRNPKHLLVSAIFFILSITLYFLLKDREIMKE